MQVDFPFTLPHALNTSKSGSVIGAGLMRCENNPHRSPGQHLF